MPTSIHFFRSTELLGTYLCDILSSCSQIVIITDSHVHEKAAPELLSGLNAGQPMEIIELEPGEDSKSPEVLIHILETMASLELDRQSVVLNLGGGVVSDIGGLAASLFKRGIRYINIPTSLIGMADAAIGGKTAIDLAGIKNIIGTFHWPESILICPDFLNSLPQEELFSGFAEMIKTAIIGDALLFETLEYLNPAEPEELKPFIERCAIIKDKIVQKDPFDREIRKTLNFGHTVGHAIESAMLQAARPLTHGHAVASGMFFETEIAFRLGILVESARRRIQQLITSHYELRIDTSTDDILGFIYQDKKNDSGKIRMALPDKIGSCLWDMEVEAELISRVLNEHR